MLGAEGVKTQKLRLSEFYSENQMPQRPDFQLRLKLRGYPCIFTATEVTILTIVVTLRNEDDEIMDETPRSRSRSLSLPLSLSLVFLCMHIVSLHMCGNLVAQLTSVISSAKNSHVRREHYWYAGIPLTVQSSGS